MAQSSTQLPLSQAGKLDAELHALSQPLTSLQFGLEIGLLSRDANSARDALEAGLGELKRISSAVQRMRSVIASMAEEEGRTA